MSRSSIFRAYRLVLLTSLALPVTAGAALAQSQIELEEIEVEARQGDGTGPVEGYRAEVTTSGSKTATPVIETPQAVSTIGAEQISVQAARTVTEATRYSPGVRSETFGSDTRNDWFLIRGFTSQEGSVFVDDMQLFASSFATWKMNPYLLERIDVLRGPSSALYGSSNPGGLINMITKRPTGQNRGQVEIGVNEHGNVWSGVDVEGVSEDGDWAYRIVSTGNAGETEVDFTENDRFAFAPTLTWTPTDQTSLELYANFQKFKTNGQNFLPYLGTVVDAPFGRIPRDLFTSEPSVDEHDRTQAMVGYRFEHAFNEAVTVRQNLRYAHLDLDFRTVYGVGYASPPTATDAELARFGFLTTPVAGLFNVDNQLQWDVETGPLEHRFLFGLDYKRYDLDDAQAFNFETPLDLLDPVYGSVTPITPADYYNLNTTVQDQIGVYAQDQMTFAERWHLVLSGRYDSVDTDVTARNTGATTSQETDAFSGRAGLIYTFDNGFAPYVSVSRSFLPLLGTDDATGRPFEPETGIQYEAGIKFQPDAWGDSYIGVSAFDLTRQNVVTSDGLVFNRQIGEVRSRGVEIEAVGQITPDWRVIGALTWYDLEITEGNPAEIGKVPTATPEQMASLWLDYTLPESVLAGLTLGGGVRYVGPSYADTANTLKVPSTVLVDAALRYEKENFGAALNVSNIFDETYVQGCSSPTACFYGEGREVSVTLSYKW